MDRRSKGDLGFSSAGVTITRSTTERMSLADGRSVHPPLLLSCCKPCVAADQDEFSPGRWRPQVFLNSRSILFR
jgi:hypothetical protein